jgi:hypothetical protein
VPFCLRRGVDFSGVRRGSQNRRDRSMKGEIPNVGAHDLSKKTSALVNEGDGQANQPQDEVDPYCYFNSVRYSPGSVICAEHARFTCKRNAAGNGYWKRSGDC